MNLPEDWEQRVSSDGRVYFANLRTKTTHWQLPNFEEEKSKSTPNPQAVPVYTSNKDLFETISVHRKPPPPPYPGNSNETYSSQNLPDLNHYTSQKEIEEENIQKYNPEQCKSLSELLKLAEDEEIISTKKPKFSLQSTMCLEIQVTNKIFIRRGTMVAFRGDLKFERGSKSSSIGMKILKKATGAGPSMVKVLGVGKIFVADYCKRVQILTLHNEKLVVNGSDILAFEDSLQWTMKVMESPSAMIQGGIFSVEIKGSGVVCIATHGIPILLKTGPYLPLRTDPNSTVCWSGNLTPVLKTDINLKSFIGLGSGEEFQMEFRGTEDGFVMVQPYEEAIKL